MRAVHRPVALGIALLLALQAGLAQAAPVGFEDALNQFIAATSGNTDAVEPAATRFERLSKAAPSDPVLKAYAGAALSMRATTTMLPWQKMRYAEDGLALIDKALGQLTPAHEAVDHPHAHQGVPATLAVRYTASTTFLALPPMFNRQQRGRALFAQVVNSPSLATAPAGFQASVWLRAAALARQDGQVEQERDWLRKVAGSKAPQAAQAQAQLKALQ